MIPDLKGRQSCASLEEQLGLSDDEVHVWCVSLEISPIHMRQMHDTLDHIELSRASQFRFLKDRDQFITCRGLLRHILSLYLHQEPGRLHLGSNAFGKPHLRMRKTEKHDVRFNYSRSGGLAVFAFARGTEVGVDIERVRPQIAQDSIPEHFFNKNEVSALRALPPDSQGDAFFRCWTRKEAYIKARGEGFRIPLESFEVFADRVVTERGNTSWSLRTFVPDAGYVAALATEGQHSSVRFIPSTSRIFNDQEGVP